MTEAPAVKAHRKGAGRVAFLARADLFRSLLRAGHPQRSIYADHAADLGISYSQFNRYVSKYLQGKGNDYEHQNGGFPAPGNETDAGNGNGNGNHAPGKPSKPRFKYNPNSGNDRNDLI